jgi:hypothetical protein
MESIAREIHLIDLLGPTLGAIGVVLSMSLLREPARQRLNAIVVAGAGSAYLNGGLGLWELPFVFLATTVAYFGLRSYRYIGIAWLLHTAWDVVHHLYGNPIWPWQPTSSFGCAVMDSLIAIWFLAGAPSVFELRRSSAHPAPTA